LPNGRILLSQRHRARAGSVGDGSRPSPDAKASFAPTGRGVKALLDQSATHRSIIASATLGLLCPSRRQQIGISKVIRKPEISWTSQNRRDEPKTVLPAIGPKKKLVDLRKKLRAR
jgi:hypothetical protein